MSTTAIAITMVTVGTISTITIMNTMTMNTKPGLLNM
jgi:hypothetical protein